MTAFLCFTRELRETYLTLRTGIYGLIKFVRKARLIFVKLREKKHVLEYRVLTKNNLRTNIKCYI